MRTAVLYLALVLGVAAALSFVGKFWMYVRLADGATSTNAVVKQQTCSDHLLIRYEFSANGRSFEGSASTDACHNLPPGTAVTVFYLPTDPAFSVIGEPTSHLRNEGLSIALAAFVLPAFLLWAYARRKSVSGA